MRVKKSRENLQQSWLLYLGRETNNPQSFSVYSKVCRAFNKELAKLLLAGETYQLPYNLGLLSVRRRKAKFKNLKFDFGEYNKTGIKTYHLNQHSNEWYGFLHWSKFKCKVRGKRVYQFIFTRDNKRALSQIFQEQGGYQRYQVAPIKRKKK